jgi:hypothetical protein
MPQPGSALHRPRVVRPGRRPAPQPPGLVRASGNPHPAQRGLSPADRHRRVRTLVRVDPDHHCRHQHSSVPSIGVGTAAGMPNFGAAGRSFLFRATPRRGPAGWHLVRKPDHPKAAGRRYIEPARRASQRYGLTHCHPGQIRSANTKSSVSRCIRGMVAPRESPALVRVVAGWGCCRAMAGVCAGLRACGGTVVRAARDAGPPWNASPSVGPVLGLDLRVAQCCLEHAGQHSGPGARRPGPPGSPPLSHRSSIGGDRGEHDETAGYR